jgi:hypothetical protein
VRESTGLKLGQIAEQRPRGADGAVIVRTYTKPVEGGETEPAGQLLSGEIGVKLPALTGCE